MMDSIEDFQLKHGSLIGGARKGCICLSLRLAVFLQSLINISYSLILTLIFFVIPFEHSGLNEKIPLSSSENSAEKFDGIFRIGVFSLEFLKRYLSQESISYISNVVLLLRESSFERNFTIAIIILMFFSSLFSIFGATSRSQGQIKTSILLFLVSQLLSIMTIFYAPNFARTHNIEVLSSPAILLVALLCVMLFSMWYTHLLYSLYKVIRAGGNGSEYLSYREIIDRRNFLRWKTWKERELERGSPYNPSFSRSSEKDRLIKTSR